MDGQEIVEEGGENSPVAVIPEASEKNEVLALADKVFGIDLVRDIIVDHAIHQADGSLDTAMICTLRTLGVGWNDSVCRLLHKNNQPLYKIHLGRQNSLNGTRNSATVSELLDQLTKTFECSSGVLGRHPTFELSICREAFKPENYTSLYNFLLGCGQGLVKLNWYIRRYQDLVEGMFPNLSLPALHKAVLNLVDFGTCQSDNANVTYLLQTIFRGCRRLKEVDILQYYPREPSLFKGIVLPSTLTGMDLLLEFDSEDLEMLLLKNPLPNLTSLTLSLSEDHMEEGLLPRILEKVGRTLKSLSLGKDTDYPDDDDPENTVLFRFPRMEKLEVFKTSSERFVPESTGTPSLDTCLPKLRKLHFSGKPADILRKWANVSRFFSVHELKIEAVDGMLYLDRHLISQIHLAMPNVTKLELRVPEIHTATLKGTFTEMSNLVELRIRKEGTIDPTLTDWDSVLIGVPSYFKPLLQVVTPQFWEHIELSEEDPSIRKLTELRILSLKDYSLDEPLMIDVSFYFAFLKMPQLQKLEFSDKFSVSSEMEDKWRINGRLLNYVSE